MSNIIDSIQISGVTYTLSAQTSGGGVTTGEVQTMIDESISGKVDTSAITTSITSSSTDTQVPSTKAVYKVYTGCVTTNTDQNITGTKTFTGEKKILFKQQASTIKLGFTLQNSASTNNELGTFEFRPNTFIIDGVQHPLLYLGHYRNSMVANAGVPQTVVGFRQYDQKNTAAYHYLIPLPEKAKTPFSLTTSYKDYYAPIGFKIDNSTMVTTDNTGVVDLSSYVGGIDSGTVQTMIDESISGKTNQSDFTGHTADTTIHVTAQDKTNWNAKSDFSGDYNDLTNKLSAGTNITIVDNVISASGGGGGKAIEAGRGITVTTGATADTVSLNLAIESGTGVDSIAEGSLTQAIGNYSHAEGGNTVASGNRSHAEGFNTTASGQSSHAEGVSTETKNYAEHASGRFNVSSSGSSTFGDSGNTLFSVGNGTAANARHNAFEIRQDGSIFITSGGTDIKLQDHLGGGGGITSGEVQTMIDESISGKTDTSAFTVHTSDTNIHVTTAQTAAWDAKQNALTIDSTVTSGSTNPVQGGAVYTQLGGLKLVKLTQSAYDALSPDYDSNTLYVIVN